MASTIGKYLILLLVIILWALTSPAASSRASTATTMSMKHEQWMAHHGRVYKSSEEKEKRFKIFKDNVEFIQNFNRAGNQTYKLGINKFTDLTDEEFLSSHTGTRVPSYQTDQSSSATPFRYESMCEVPPSVDWRERGAVTPVKYQGQCGSCAVFSAVAAIEGITQITTGRLISLSEQQILDCDYVPDTCGGTYVQQVFNVAIQNQGLTAAANYPYIGREGSTCWEYPAAARITGYESVPTYDEQALQKAVANQPVSVRIDPSLIKFYESGIFSSSYCGMRPLDHEVTVVGYGTSEDGTKFWTVKNSWSTGWGENGYVRFQRDVGTPQGMCGIATEPYYPTA